LSEWVTGEQALAHFLTPPEIKVVPEGQNLLQAVEEMVSEVESSLPAPSVSRKSPSPDNSPQAPAPKSMRTKPSKKRLRKKSKIVKRKIKKPVRK
jgi:hypothetical protein